MNTQIFAQAIGIAAMIMNVCSYQRKSQKKIIVMQFFSSVLFCINMLMIGALMGGLMNIAGIARAVVFFNKERLGRSKPWWIAGFTVLYFVLYVCTFTVFGKAVTVPNLIVEFLPVVGMTSMTIGFAVNSAKYTRLLGLINSPSWLIYNIANGAIGGIIAEVFGIVSIMAALLRFSRNGESDDLDATDESEPA
ncbi:MAG: YgjV family protein [Clostridia bacterium]|nr:YgjV family protein [Clostridia bacterium]